MFKGTAQHSKAISKTPTKGSFVYVASLYWFYSAAYTSLSKFSFMEICLQEKWYQNAQCSLSVCFSFSQTSNIIHSKRRERNVGESQPWTPSKVFITHHKSSVSPLPSQLLRVKLGSLHSLIANPFYKFMLFKAVLNGDICKRHMESINM